MMNLEVDDFDYFEGESFQLFRTTIREV